MTDAPIFATSATGRVTPLTIVTFLFGSRQSVLRIAQSASAVWIGGLFVLSAGFAREYDGEDLAAEPWHLLIPFAASVLTSFLLFLCVDVAARSRGAGTYDFLRMYGRFLGLYWMTAPLAWLYALPVERWGSAVQSVEWNLWLLAIVSAWRVALMIRVVSVVYATEALSAAWVVCLFAAAVAAVAAWISPMPVISFMGGVRLSESDALIQRVTFNLRIGTVLVSLVLSIVGIPVFFIRSKPKWALAIELANRIRLHPAVWLLPAAALAVWPFVLPQTQPEQRLRRTVEQLLVTGRIADALQFMSQHERKDFPPHWDPPPRIGYTGSTPPLLDIIEEIVAHPPADWVRLVYVNKLRDRFGDSYGYEFSFYWASLTLDQRERFVTAMEALPEAAEILKPPDADYSDIPLYEDDGAVELVERLRRIVDKEQDADNVGETASE